MVMTMPVTSGGSATRILPMKRPRIAWKTPPTTTPPIRTAIPSTPLPATSGIMIGRNAKLVPCITGSRAPTGPMPIV